MIYAMRWKRLRKLASSRHTMHSLIWPSNSTAGWIGLGRYFPIFAPRIRWATGMPAQLAFWVWMTGLVRFHASFSQTLYFLLKNWRSRTELVYESSDQLYVKSRNLQRNQASDLIVRQNVSSQKRADNSSDKTASEDMPLSKARNWHSIKV